MIAFLLLAHASLTAIGEPAPVANMPSGQWATVRIEPSFAEIHTEIVIGTLRYDRERKQLDFWMRREDRDRQGGSLSVRWADSRKCAPMRAAIGAMREIGPMQIDPPDPHADLVVTADGTLYTLEAPGRYANGHAGTIKIHANVRTPLAGWAERLQSDMVNCWTAKAPSA
ncbi:hypothetical protein [Sphingobium sp.]|uniref:hypothetical protein n=1 Tax=Sphingobium sp. TaxID=1912891 RepID=UPI000DB2C82F|nr:hypothetical protein [Sphingobium sp.]PZU62804.1 MAG: hypothetical protein DI540_25775 [Sphingobium sp.]